ncbi:hypothetical protein EUGRSUZ_G00325 [Eucalyptus grandis]|uniref:Uncharacterized protein n=2 Tax=Eucalyptus grandis TaxID=71139 RepID=A0ACC3K2C6_EUCGR|nr:hypothetical protein EUGRSUZ_G00325 [Eucalyptus grandis]
MYLRIVTLLIDLLALECGFLGFIAILFLLQPIFLLDGQFEMLTRRVWWSQSSDGDRGLSTMRILFLCVYKLLKVGAFEVE